MNTPEPIWNAETKRRLLRVALAFLDSPELAEEVIQQAYLRLLGSDFNAIEHPSNWLVTVTRNLAIDRARRMARERELLLLLPGFELPECPEQAHAVENRLADLISSLLHASGSYAASIVLLHVVFGLSYEEIAAICGRSPAACRQIASRALRRCFSFIDSDAVHDRVADTADTDVYVQAIVEASMTPLFEILSSAGTVNANGVPVCYASSDEGMRQVLVLHSTGVQWVLIHNSRVLSVLGSASQNKMAAAL